MTTLNKLIDLLEQASYQLSSGDIPITINNQKVEIKNVTVESNDNDFWCNINLEKQKQPN